MVHGPPFGAYPGRLSGPLCCRAALVSGQSLWGAYAARVVAADEHSVNRSHSPHHGSQEVLAALRPNRQFCLGISLRR